MTTIPTVPLHRPPSGLQIGLVGIAAGSVLILLAAQPTSWEMQIAGSICLLVCMFILSLIWRDRPQLRSADVVRLILIFSTTLLSLRYLIWRGTESLPLESGLPSAALGVTLFIVECYCFVVATFSYIPNLKILQRDPIPLPDNASLWPEVDVYITTFDEDPELLKTTLIAATQMRYPSEKLSVYLLDDGGTQQMLNQSDAVRADEALARAGRLKEISNRYGAKYLTRQKNIHAKAGNLNNALQFTQGKFIVVLDCDHVPTEDFLEKTLGFFLQDEQLFLVQTAHHFVTPDPLERNLSLHEHSPRENEMFYHSVMPGLDYWGSAFFCGSAAVLRRSALDDIGGFSTDTITEDAETTLNAFSKNYTSLFLDKGLVSGLQPASFSGFIKQRSRWAQGMWQIFLLKNPWRLKGLKFMQRVMYTNFALFWGFPISRLYLIFMPIIALIWGVTLAETTVPELLSYCGPALLGSLITGQYLHGRFRWPLISYLYQVLQSVHLAKSEIKLFTNIRAPKFLVTPKAEISEEDFLSSLAKPFYGLLAISAAALTMGIIRMINEPTEFYTLLFIMFWASIDCLFILCALGVTFERRQRRVDPRPQTDNPIALKIGSAQLHEGLLTDASTSGAGMVINNHSDIWVALLQKKAANLIFSKNCSLDAKIKKVSQLPDGRISVGLNYDTKSTADERLAVAIAYGSSDQIQKNMLRYWHRKNTLSVFITLTQKALALGFGHLYFLLNNRGQSKRRDFSSSRLIWEKKNENTPAPSHHQDLQVSDHVRDHSVGIR